MSQNPLINHCYVCVLQQDIITLKKSYFKQYSGVISVFFFTLIINIEGNYVFFVHCWHQTFIVLVLVISILTQDMSVNNTSNSSVFHILSFHNSELG